jgi:hypothetical protein
MDWSLHYESTIVFVIYFFQLNFTILLELLNHDQFGRGLHALSEDDISLAKTEDLRSVHLCESDLVDELAVQTWHEVTISSHEFVEGGQVSEATTAPLFGVGGLRLRRLVDVCRLKHGN